MEKHKLLKKKVINRIYQNIILSKLRMSTIWKTLKRQMRG